MRGAISNPVCAERACSPASAAAHAGTGTCSRTVRTERRSSSGERTSILPPYRSTSLSTANNAAVRNRTVADPSSPRTTSCFGAHARSSARCAVIGPEAQYHLLRFSRPAQSVEAVLVVRLRGEVRRGTTEVDGAGDRTPLYYLTRVLGHLPGEVRSGRSG